MDYGETGQEKEAEPAPIATENSSQPEATLDEPVSDRRGSQEAPVTRTKPDFLRRLDVLLSNRRLRHLFFVLVVVLVAALAQAMATWGIDLWKSAALYVLTILLGIWAFRFSPASQPKVEGRFQRLKESWPLFALFCLSVLVLAQSMVGLATMRNEIMIVLLLAVAVSMGAIWSRALGLADQGIRRLSAEIALLFSFVTALSGALLLMEWSDWRVYGALLLYGIGLLLALLGFALREGWDLGKMPKRLWSCLQEHRAELLALVVILSVGLFLRVYRLDYYPPSGGISWIDEAQIGKEAHDILTSDRRPWEFPVLIYSTALAFRLWGESVVVLRLASILFGWLTLIPFYFLARSWFGVEPALAATFLFAFSRWHMAMVRISQPWMTSMFLMLVLFLCLRWGLDHRGKMSFALAGYALALSIYSLAATNLVFIFFVLVLLLGRAVGAAWSVPAGQRRAALVSWVREHTTGLFIMLIAFTLCILPYAFLVSHEPTLMTERFTSVMPGVFGQQTPQLPQMWENFRRAIMLFNFEGALWPGVNIPQQPMLDPLSGALFGLGLLYCLAYFWRNDHYFLLAWFLVTLIGGGALVNTLVSHRLANLIPAIYLFICAILAWVWREYRQALPGKEHYLVPFAAVLLGISAWYNFDLFFNNQIYRQDVRAEFDSTQVGVANHIRRWSKDHYVALFATYPFYDENSDLNWVAGHPRGRAFKTIGNALPARMEQPLALAYYFVPPYRGNDLVNVVRKTYPGATSEKVDSENGHYSFYVARVREEEVLSVRGLTGRYWPEDQSEKTAVMRHEPTMNLDNWRNAAPLPLPFVAEWRGSIFIPRSDPYLITLRGVGRAEVYVDGTPMNRERLLAQGWHGLRAVYHTGDRAHPVNLFKRGPDGILRPIPSSDLSTLEGPRGLLASYYETPDWEGEPTQQRIEEALVFLGTPETACNVQWEGQLLIEKSGSYLLEASVRKGSLEMSLDGESALSTVLKEKQEEGVASTRRELTAGEHSLLARYTCDKSPQSGPFAGVSLYWTTPYGTSSEIIPPDRLRPALEKTVPPPRPPERGPQPPPPQ